MSLWNVTKKIGAFTLDVGLAIGKGLISAGQEAKENKSLNNDQLKEKSEDTGFLSKTTSIERKLAKMEMDKRSKSTD